MLSGQDRLLNQTLPARPSNEWVIYTITVIVWQCVSSVLTRLPELSGSQIRWPWNPLIPGTPLPSCGSATTGMQPWRSQPASQPEPNRNDVNFRTVPGTLLSYHVLEVRISLSKSALNMQDSVPGAQIIKTIKTLSYNYIIFVIIRLGEQKLLGC